MVANSSSLRITVDGTTLYEHTIYGAGSSFLANSRDNTSATFTFTATSNEVGIAFKNSLVIESAFTGSAGESQTTYVLYEASA
jgi:hypothetical protein